MEIQRRLLTNPNRRVQDGSGFDFGFGIADFEFLLACVTLAARTTQNPQSEIQFRNPQFEIPNLLCYYS